ncbi:MAG: transglutaminase family protein [Pirellulales bacterium]
MAISVMDYGSWTRRTSVDLQADDCARWNFELAADLPGGETIDVDACCRQLDAWTNRVRHETQRLLPCFDRDRSRFDNSRARFHLMAMVTVLQRDLGVRYAPACMTGDYDARDCRPWFIHGLLSGRGGTCVSLPMLYLAVGRRLGYPLFLCESASHFFVRWDGEDERLNVECTSLGYRKDAESDDHFRRFPQPLPPVLERSGCVLRELWASRDARAHAAATQPLSFR